MKKEEARKKAFEYFVGHYGHLILIDDEHAVYAAGHWAFVLRSNYPRFDNQKKLYLTKCEHLGEIVVHITGAIVSATPRQVVVKRLKLCLKEAEELIQIGDVDDLEVVYGDTYKNEEAKE